MRLFLLIGVVVWHVSSSNAMAVENKNVEALQAVTQSANTFAPNFFKHVAAANKGNLICSPLSASMVLSMAAYGARGENEKDMRKALALPASNELAKAGFQTFIDSLSNYKQVTLHMANKMFVAKDLEPKADFKAMTKDGFRSEAQNVDFSASAEASKTINDWCEDQTNHRIKDLISPDDVDASTALVLVNAVYFKGNWANKFDPESTKPLPFHVNGTAELKDVPTMYRYGSYNYGELPEVKAKFVEIPYKSEGSEDAMSMFIILPDEIDGLAEVESKIEQISVEKLQSGNKRDVNLYLPKFKIESKMDLKEPLEKMGMGRMFTSNADFTGIVDSPPLQVSKVVQKAFIEVNEEGSEAAAATGVMFMPASLPIRYEFRVDRPFFYAIVKRQETGGVFVFTGRCSDLE